MPTGIMIVVNVFMVVWILLACWVIAAPKSFWKVTQSWKAAKEPKPTYFAMMRVLAALMLVGAVTLWNRL